MKEIDIQKLGQRERTLLELSFRPGQSEKRVRNILWSALLVFAGLLLFSRHGSGLRAITGFAVVVVIVSAIEKLTYAREIWSYKSLVRALTHRLEEVQGIELTPSGGRPADSSRRAARREGAHAESDGGRSLFAFCDEPTHSAAVAPRAQHATCDFRGSSAARSMLDRST